MLLWADKKKRHLGIEYIESTKQNKYPWMVRISVVFLAIFPAKLVLFLDHSSI